MAESVDPTQPAILIEGITKRYGSGSAAVDALKGVDMTVYPGEVVGLIGFVVGKIAATLWGPAFPKYVLLLPSDAVSGFVIVMIVCALASTLAIRAALKVDPATAIGG